MESINSLPNFYGLGSASDDKVNRAEEQLGLTFAPDYRAYVGAYGVASANGHELTGVTDAERLDVVKVTLAERKLIDAIDDSWYVVEQVGIDGVTAWQDGAGDIFVTIGGAGPKKIASSLFEYVSH